MEIFACKLENILKQKFALYCELLSVMEAERSYIINVDIQSLWTACAEKKKITIKIEKIKSEIIDLINQNSLNFDMEYDLDPAKLSIMRIIRQIPAKEKYKLGIIALVRNINLKKDELHVISSENGKYVREYLDVINDIMSTIVGFSNENSYTYAGRSNALVNGHCLIDAEV